MASAWKVLRRAGAAFAVVALGGGGCGHGSIDLFAEGATESGGQGGEPAWQPDQGDGGDTGLQGGRNSWGGAGPWPNAGCDSEHPCLTGLVCNGIGTCVQCTREDPSQCAFPQPPVCNLRGLCAECMSNQDCSRPDYSVCDGATNTCRAACNRDDNCGPSAPHCRWDGVCVECDPNLNSQCPRNSWCSEGGFCAECLSDQNCVFYPKVYCNVAHRCVQCIVDAQCGDFYRCDSGVCVSTVAP
jgi:hypothetical protein